jgi:hypothetical protein
MFFVTTTPTFRVGGEMRTVAFDLKRNFGCQTRFTESVSIVKATRYTNVSKLFYWSNILHVSEGISAHHQELKTVRTETGICQTDYAVCLLAAYVKKILPIAI